MFCTRLFLLNFLLFFLILISDANAMKQDDLDEYHYTPFVKQKAISFDNETSVSRIEILPIGLMDLPEEMVNEIFINYLKQNEFLLLRATSKKLKERIDEDFWENHTLTIRTKSSSPVLQEILDIPCHTVSLFCHKWENKDFEHLLSFKHVTHLQLSGLQSWDFSTNEAFTPSWTSSLCTYFKSFIDYEDPSESLFTNLTSLDLSGSKIGSYGVTCFLSKFKNLQILNLSKNDIGNEKEDDAKALANSTTLTSLDISHNEFSDAAIKEITQLKTLTSLNISYNFISGNNAIRELKQALPKLAQLINYGQKQKYRSSSYIPTPGIYTLLPWPAFLRPFSSIRR